MRPRVKKSCGRLANGRYKYHPYQDVAPTGLGGVTARGVVFGRETTIQRTNGPHLRDPTPPKFLPHLGVARLLRAIYRAIAVPHATRRAVGSAAASAFTPQNHVEAFTPPKRKHRSQEIGVYAAQKNTAFTA
jgi:hypothetical protein